MSEFTRASGGQPLKISAKAYNAMLDAAQAYAREQDVFGASGSKSGRPPHVLRVKNTTGLPALRFSFLGIGSPIIEASTAAPGSGEDEYDVQTNFFANCNAFSVVTPVFDDHEKRWCILLESIPDGEFGAAAVLGVYPCQVDVQAESDTEAQLVNAQTDNLESCESGGTADILWKESGTGLKWALVYVRPFGATGGGGAVSLDIVQAVADGSAGVVSTKVMTLKADVSASPNFTLAASAANANYFKL